MKNKVAIDQVEHTASSVGIEQDKVRTLVQDLRKAIEEESELSDKEPRVKKRLVIVANVSGKDENLVKLLSEIPFSVVECAEDFDHNQVVGQVCVAAYDFNANNKKGVKKPVKTVFEALEIVPAKHFKPTGVNRKTKEPVIVVTTDNIIPTETV